LYSTASFCSFFCCSSFAALSSLLGSSERILNRRSLQFLFLRKSWKNSGISQKESISFSQSFHDSAAFSSFQKLSWASVTEINDFTPPSCSNCSKKPQRGAYRQVTLYATSSSSSGNSEELRPSWSMLKCKSRILCADSETCLSAMNLSKTVCNGSVRTRGLD